MEEEADSKEDEEIGEQDKMKKVEEKNDKNHMKEEKNTELNEEKESKTSGKGKRRAEKKSVEGKVGKKKKVAEEKEQETRTPASDRPQRERKSVERLVASIERDSGKEFQIEKGRGTPLKDIPNVAFKLSRKKTDDTFKLLHSILFGRRGKAIQIKTNISRFSGFVWHENEEKQKIKVKEKFDKINKEKLLEFCDVLDIPIARATTRKEDIVIKLIDFLVSPHATTTVLLAEREKVHEPFIYC
uniref:DEK C-terminal domain-containing protein n=1 Tax=Rhizophora mucronata TaxID=61149 RepID=A0A2P2LVT6_RHIMU